MGLEKLIIKGKINILGVIAAILVLAVVFMGKPWWTLRGGEGFLEVTYSPTNIDITVLGKPINIPIIPYLTQAATIALALSAILLLVGSLIAGKSIGLSLTKVGYDKPLIITIVFTAALYMLPKMIGQTLGVGVPVTGEKILTLETMIGGVKVHASIPVKAELLAEYYVAWFASVIALVSGIVHRLGYKALTRSKSTK